MSTYGWNMAFTNGRPFGRDQLRSYGSNISGLPCRICDKVYPSTQALIEHYESHGNDFVPQRHNHQMTQVQPYQRGDVNLGDNPFHHHNSNMISALPQGYHPYFPNGYRNLVANANSQFLVPTQNPQPYQPRNYPVGNNSALPVSLAGTSQFAVKQPSSNHDGIHVPHLQLGASTSMNRNNATLHPPSVPGAQKSAPSLRIEDQKGYDESGDKRTIWYLGQLDHPIPEIIDLDSSEESHQSPKL